MLIDSLKRGCSDIDDALRTALCGVVGADVGGVWHRPQLLLPDLESGVVALFVGVDARFFFCCFIGVGVGLW